MDVKGSRDFRILGTDDEDMGATPEMMLAVTTFTSLFLHFPPGQQLKHFLPAMTHSQLLLIQVPVIVHAQQ